MTLPAIPAAMFERAFEEKEVFVDRQRTMEGWEKAVQRPVDAKAEAKKISASPSPFANLDSSGNADEPPQQVFLGKSHPQ